MRQNTVAAAILMWVASTSLQAQAPASSTVGADRSPVVLEQAPKDHAIAFPKEKLAQHVRDMDARQLQTLRLIEGGKYNVNLRRLKAAGPASAQPVTANLWVVLEGGGTLTTGGALGAGKINGGRTRVLKPGDLVYLPSGLPHGVSSVNGNLTFLDVRWDTDWPADSPMGAGTLTGLTGGTPAPRAGAAPPPRVPLPAGSQQALPFSYGGSGEVFFARETLDELMAGMRVRKSINTRLIEGGRYNINLRWNGTPTMEIHERTIDTWFLLAGNATVNTGNQVANDARVANTGVFNPAKPGDVFFIPSNLHHGYSDVSPDVFWLNIRWDDNYKKD